ncbi:hypothetical protein [Acinetobacter gyllenbergii]|uniref:hypothetical protein n=1 Tax=Acinetobacter gyllenbergii TaxID=134534 RepID=UPI003F55714B
MFDKMLKGVKFLYVTIPLKGLLANLGYKQLKQSYEVNKKQFQQIRNPVCPICFTCCVNYEKRMIDRSEDRSEKQPENMIQLVISCDNPKCSLDERIYSIDDKKKIKKSIDDLIVKIGDKKRELLLKELSPSFINMKINEHYQKAIMFKWLAIACFSASILTFILYGFMAFLCWMLFGAGIFLLSLKSAFHCWQAQTFNVFRSTSLFMFWFKNNQWYKKPILVHLKN